MKNNEKFFLNVVSNVIIVVILLSVVFLSLSGSVANVSNTKTQPYYYGNTKSNFVSIMFNVYSGTQYLPQILETLKKHNVQITFFVGGCWVEKNTDVFLSIVKNGHEIGNHGYFHKDHDKISKQTNIDEINVTHKLVESLSSISMNLFAPPSGAYSATTIEVATSLGYQTIMWSKDTIDWRDQNVDLIFQRATKNVKGGDLILMHPTEYTAKALDKILTYYKNNDLQVVTVSQNISN